MEASSCNGLRGTADAGHLFVLNSGSGGPAWNMALDEALLHAIREIGCPVLRFYSWTEPAGSFGYSQRYTDVEKTTRLRPLIRRPTGGGLVPHDADWTYSLVFPAEHFWYRLSAEQSYASVHEWIRLAFAGIGVTTELSPCCRKEVPGQCFVGAEKHDLLWHGRKIAGAAQRRPKEGLLIQGSVQPPPIGLPRASWEGAMRETGRDILRGHWSEYSVPEHLAQYAEVLRVGKYSSTDHNQKR